MIKSKTLFLFISLILLIIFRFFTTRPNYEDGDFVRISSPILSDPIHYPMSVYVKIAGLKIYLPKETDISYGDKVIIEGEVNSNTLKNPKLVKIEKTRNFLSNFRKAIITFYQKALPEPMAGLLSGIVIGAKGALSPNFYNQVKNTGVAHVVVASGTNITFVCSFLMGVLTYVLPRKKAILFVIVGCILYLFIAGFDPPLIRAAIMISFVFLAQEGGRVVYPWRILLMAAISMLIYNPNWIQDIGFILSFASTASLMLFERRIRAKLSKVPKILKEGLSTSLAAQLGVAPILFVTFGQFNLLSPIVNALVLWVVPYIMILGVIGEVVGLVFPFLGKMVLWASYPLLWWFVHIVTLFSF